MAQPPFRQLVADSESHMACDTKSQTLQNVEAKIDLLANYHITTVHHLDTVASRAYRRDNVHFVLKSLAEYLPFAANDWLQAAGVAGCVAAYGEAHGLEARSAGAILLAIVTNVALPALGFTAAARAAQNLSPQFIFPDTPEYRHPDITNNPDFAPIVTLMLPNLLYTDLLFISIKELLPIPMQTVWPNLKPAVGVSAAFTQTCEAWKILRGRRHEIPDSLHDGTTRYRQPWLARSSEGAVRRDLKNLCDLSVHEALFVDLCDLAYETVCMAPRNLAVAVAHPGTAATFFVLAPSAVFSYLANITQDPTDAFAWSGLASISAIGLPGTGVGMTNHRTVQRVLQKMTFNRWSPENADQFGIWCQAWFVCVIPRRPRRPAARVSSPARLAHLRAQYVGREALLPAGLVLGPASWAPPALVKAKAAAVASGCHVHENRGGRARRPVRPVRVRLVRARPPRPTPPTVPQPPLPETLSGVLCLAVAPNSLWCLVPCCGRALDCQVIALPARAGAAPARAREPSRRRLPPSPRPRATALRISTDGGVLRGIRPASASALRPPVITAMLVGIGVCARCAVRARSAGADPGIEYLMFSALPSATVHAAQRSRWDTFLRSYPYRTDFRSAANGDVRKLNRAFRRTLDNDRNGHGNPADYTLPAESVHVGGVQAVVDSTIDGVAMDKASSLPGEADDENAVVLSGEGSDEIFGGYQWFPLDYLRQADPAAASLGISLPSEAERRSLSQEIMAAKGLVLPDTSSLQKSNGPRSLLDISAHLTVAQLSTSARIPLTAAMFPPDVLQVVGNPSHKRCVEEGIDGRVRYNSITGYSTGTASMSPLYYVPP
ncbi:hypothetical protein GGX14DRAFT_700815 [Mycena pura]|uniref:Asparagine synthetase domain-containing protein n=1 Tax=Mycena pura TaxID=153505 RepID=A0AAD6Y1Q7_9AGAR|nr:hypothetical protein GGX14DRAFT_700815 [Mycena pura]